MKWLLLALIGFSTSSFALDLIPTLNDFHPEQTVGEKQIYMQKRTWQGTDFAIAYSQGGVQIGKPQVEGFCLWENRVSVQACVDDHDPRIKQYVESLAGPKMVCLDKDFKFTMRLKDDHLVTDIASWGISEADGPTYMTFAHKPVTLTDRGGDCPMEIAGQDLRLCLTSTKAPTGTYDFKLFDVRHVSDGKTLNCKIDPDFVNAIRPLIKKAALDPLDDFSDQNAAR